MLTGAGGFSFAQLLRSVRKKMLNVSLPCSGPSHCHRGSSIWAQAASHNALTVTRMLLRPGGARAARTRNCPTPVPSPPPWMLKHPPLLPGHVVGPVYQPPVVHTVVIGGTPGWQIALIALGAALLAATVAVLAYRAWTMRRKPVTAAA